MKRAAYWLVVGPLYLLVLPFRVLVWLFIEEGIFVLLIAPIVIARVVEGKKPDPGDEGHPLYRLRDWAHQKPTGGEVSLAEVEDLHRVPR